MAFQHIVTSTSELAEMLGQPSEIALKKQLPALDRHMKAFIAKSPYLALATVGADGRCDVSPRGDAPGFVSVLDDRTIVIPERPGNRRADSLRNVVETGRVGLLFLSPGLGETLRVNGTASVIRDADVLSRMTFQGKQPVFGIAVNVEECFLHCARSILRAQLWSTAPELPTCSFAEALMEQVNSETVTLDQIQERIRTGYTNLY